jgi:general secretion pathway protein D
VDAQAMAGLLGHVYRNLATLRSTGSGQRSTVALIPVVKPNAVLILAGAADLQSILDLADKLDQPVDPQLPFEVFALKSAVATEVVRTIDSLFSGQGGATPTTGQPQQGQAAASTGGLRGRVRAVADVRTNSVIVQAAPNDLEEVSLLIRRVDRDSSSSVSRMRVFPLKNAVADELAQVINASIQSILSPAGSGTGGTGGGQFGGGGGQVAGGGQGSQQLREAKSVALEFLSTGGGGRGFSPTSASRPIRASTG